MANTKSAKKKIRVDARRRKINLRRKNRLKNIIKDLKKALEKSKDEAKKIFPVLQKRVDISAKTKIISKNKANRIKSRFSRKLS